MSQQPQVSLQDYSEKAIVLRAIPADFFKPYSQYLVQVGGKWNRNLKDPSGQGTLGGWIFPKTKQLQVQQAVQQIMAGQAPQNTTTTLNQPEIQTFQSLMSRIQAQHMSQESPSGSTPPIFNNTDLAPLVTAKAVAPLVPLTQPASTPNLLAPVEQLPGAAPPGYQQVIYIVIRPEKGQTLSLNVGTTKVPITVQSVQVEKGIVNQALVKTPDGQLTNIRLVNDQWIIPGYQQQHTISL
jgi:hypothetical protein